MRSVATRWEVEQGRAAGLSRSALGFAYQVVAECPVCAESVRRADPRTLDDQDRLVHLDCQRRPATVVPLPRSSDRQAA